MRPKNVRAYERMYVLVQVTVATSGIHIVENAPNFSDLVEARMAHK